MSIQAEIKNLRERVAVLETLVDANFSVETKAAWTKAVDDAAEIGAMEHGTDDEKPRRRTR